MASLSMRIVYRAQKQNTLQTVHQKCVLCTETEHFPDDTSELCTVHRNRTLYRRYIRNVYCVHRHNSFQTVHQKCVLCTETEHFPDGTSEMCTVHTIRTLFIVYTYNRIYGSQKDNYKENSTFYSHSCNSYKRHTQAARRRNKHMYGSQFMLCAYVGVSNGGGRNESNE